MMYYNTPSMCFPRPQNHSAYVCDDKHNPPLDATLRAESVDGVTWTKPPLHTLSYNGTSENNALQLNVTTSHGVDANRAIYRDPFEQDASRRYKMVGNFFSDDAHSGPLAQWPGYHFLTASSGDTVHWHDLSDISSQLQARADTDNNVVFDASSREWMIFTRIDCHYQPFNNNPSLANCSQPGYGGQGLRRHLAPRTSHHTVVCIIIS